MHKRGGSSTAVYVILSKYYFMLRKRSGQPKKTSKRINRKINFSLKKIPLRQVSLRLKSMVSKDIWYIIVSKKQNYCIQVYVQIPFTETRSKENGGYFALKIICIGKMNGCKSIF